MVISNKDRMHPGVIDGVTVDRPPPANAGIVFDQFKQDQTIGFSYSESNGRRSAGFQVWDRADASLGDLVRQLNAANTLTDQAKGEKALAAAREAAPSGPGRVFVGKTADKAATMSLADGNGKPRINITVDATGNPRIEFLDAGGRVVARIPEK